MSNITQESETRAYFEALRVKKKVIENEISSFVSKKLYDFAIENGISITSLNIFVEPLYSMGKTQPIELYVSTTADIKV